MAGNKRWYKTWWGIALIIILTVFLVLAVAIGFYFIDRVKQSSQDIKAKNVNLAGKKYQILDNNNYWLGAAKPKIIIYEFADFACSYCKNSYPNIREISLKYQDDVKIIFKDYPLHDESASLALAARCAGEQGLFWLMHDKLFQNQGITTTDQLAELAKQIGADVNRFNNCYSQQKYLSQIQKDFTEGNKLELTGTPIWFINGYKVEGDIPYNTFIQIIEQLLKN
ncbi:hypothetical protein COT96_01285 [Candidatus Falkowbacteria bacterium CG10_big_fil_rev_8_21_14_0_10_38_22]|uniref:Thioredoxin domain-containing protein n=1 Tax=Candidatus Falkowbacteria bacterium CG10_big_fil_rev_8_21_14_0_10_38_22 TaxID=1974564 RepID=A0A2M6WRU0_9BACT|nr:thioredoxin domain-containing protein [Candidatus Falkowbacteria bacterium]PIT95436.1 MAG: hypothetical protein COT96_01285 [Candidatus Falkowbacteria bacterium CG10_big_fil_rev_8_21_14_0_10_38_22]